MLNVKKVAKSTNFTCPYKSSYTTETVNETKNSLRTFTQSIYPTELNVTIIGITIMSVFLMHFMCYTLQNMHDYVLGLFEIYYDKYV